jgi:hypothetical protein
MCNKCNAKQDTSSKYIGKKFRVEKFNESKSGHHDRWAVVHGEDNIMNSFPAFEDAIESMEAHNATFELTSWQNFRQWFDSIDRSVRDEQFRKDQIHLWMQFLGLRNAMNDLAFSVLGMNWAQENTDGVCNMIGVSRDCEDRYSTPMQMALAVR